MPAAKEFIKESDLTFLDLGYYSYTFSLNGITLHELAIEPQPKGGANVCIYNLTNSKSQELTSPKEFVPAVATANLSLKNYIKKANEIYQALRSEQTI